MMIDKLCESQSRGLTLLVYQIATYMRRHIFQKIAFSLCFDHIFYFGHVHWLHFPFGTRSWTHLLVFRSAKLRESETKRTGIRSPDCNFFRRGLIVRSWFASNNCGVTVRYVHFIPTWFGRILTEFYRFWPNLTLKQRKMSWILNLMPWNAVHWASVPKNVSTFLFQLFDRQNKYFDSNCANL